MKKRGSAFHARLGHVVFPQLGSLASGGQIAQEDLSLAAQWGARMLLTAHEQTGLYPFSALEIVLLSPRCQPSPPCQNASLPLNKCSKSPSLRDLQATSRPLRWENTKSSYLVRAKIWTKHKLTALESILPLYCYKNNNQDRRIIGTLL